jgi:hypothetical protein
MATSDLRAKVVQVGPGEALALQLAQRATLAATAALHAGRYPQPSAEQFRRIAAIVSGEALLAGLALAGHPEDATDDQLDEAADRTGGAAVVEVMGPPAREAIQ